jgi:hypothetical protein
MRVAVAVYDPPQPLWKRNLAGILDFVLAIWVFGFALYELSGTSETIQSPTGATFHSWNMGNLSSAVLIVLVIAYFVVLGRTGGTVFQRLFGMKRAKKS